MLYYKEYRLAKSDEWVVFVHGAGGSSSVWYKQVKEFKKHFNVLLIDLRGHGKSRNPIVLNKKYSFDNVSRDIIEVLDHKNIKKAHFVGISLGTILIRNIGEIDPSRVQSMVLGGAVIRLNTRVKTLISLGNLTKKIIPYMWLYKFFAWCLMPKKRHHESRILFVNQAKKLCQKEFIKWFKLTNDVAPLLVHFEENKVDIPTLYVMGQEDYMFLYGAQQMVKNSEQAQLEVIKDSGHVCNVEKPEEFNDVSIDFLKGICNQRAVMSS
ncbi:2-succinyl-6-hydroxy-2,4-cyclohexadiene-1-carboxylate synthase [Halalkalibacillus sediminis]|uniref:2-succinyl-6-hydroxy-2, 4-cyclohexadiene-1-carboxylate synthase n=1 Tax=Halalkalibacillus sediminis TaxID=2018042 RepID=A0A2I0QVR0_9BACI|nr:alpha/beta hydrolase [Halalkalibacillus sediminis]PKR78200.1 2-succinyl-6-hydroxy-2,4-cyclohexadiene-1-carboxylate synthase [Halalkalibacillus sediminis]